MSCRAPSAPLVAAWKKMMLGFAVIAIVGVPAFAADGPAHGMKMEKQRMMREHPEVRKEMMRNPDHLLAMAYRMNLVAFGQALKTVARQGETVPPDFARTAIDEMKRSAEQMEKYHGNFTRSLSEDMKAKMGEMPKMMDEHMANVKTHLGHLDDLAKSSTIASKDVITHLDLLFQGCEGMDMGNMGHKGAAKRMKHRK